MHNIHDVDSDLRTVLEAGGTITDAHQQLQERWERHATSTRPFTDRFVEAVLNGAPDDEIEELRAFATLEQASGSVHEASVTNALRAAVQRRSYAEYAKVAESNWNTLAAQFNEAADRFSTAHAIIPATTDPSELITAPEKTRKAWAEGQATHPTLDALITPLLAAARLAEKNAAGDTWAIPATVRTGGLHRRRVWEAWESPNRWTELLNLGATIHACDLATLEPYREPEPIRTEYERTKFGHRPYKVDPEDIDTSPELATTR